MSFTLDCPREQLYEVVEVAVVLELDKVLRPPGCDDVYVSHSVSYRAISAHEVAE